MTLDNNGSNSSRSDRCDPSLSQDRMLPDQDSAVNRREFLGMTAASLLMAGR